MLAPVALLALLGLAAFVRPGDGGGPLLLANPDRSRVSEVRAVMARLPETPLVLVGLDPDLGTYAEIRAVVRAAFDDLRARHARLAVISFTPEGRAVAAAEIDRLERSGVGSDALLDLGFIAGAEAGMVRAVTDLVPDEAVGTLADDVRQAGGGMGAFDLALVIGGGDLGPRSWVEQVSTRLPALPIIAIAPTFAQPELAPYLRTGQLVALLATLRDGAAYVAAVGDAATPTLGDAPRERVPSALAMLLGMLLALAVLAVAVAAGLGGGSRAGGGGQWTGRRPATVGPGAEGGGPGAEGGQPQAAGEPAGGAE